MASSPVQAAGLCCPVNRQQRGGQAEGRNDAAAASFMKKSFYHFALTYRGKMRADDYSRFADAVFLDHSFPRATSDFEELSRYIEEKAHPDMKASVFDEMWDEYTRT